MTDQRQHQGCWKVKGGGESGKDGEGEGERERKKERETMP